LAPEAARPPPADAAGDWELPEYSYNLYNTMDQVSPRGGYRAGSRFGKKLLKRPLGPVLVQQTRWNRAAERTLRRLEECSRANHGRVERWRTAALDRERVNPFEQRLNQVETQLSTLREEVRDRPRSRGLRANRAARLAPRARVAQGRAEGTDVDSVSRRRRS
jgi:hypothetical protein